MNATLYDIGAAAAHREWKERTARHYDAMVANDIEVREITRAAVRDVLGLAWCRKVRRQQRQVGTFQTARNLRKQGVGLGMARLLLLGRL